MAFDKALFAEALRIQAEQGNIKRVRGGWRLTGKGAEGREMPTLKTKEELSAELYDRLFEQMNTFEDAINRADGLILLLGHQVAQRAVDNRSDYDAEEYSTAQAMGYFAYDVSALLTEAMKKSWDAVQAMRPFLKNPPAPRPAS